MRKGCLKTSWQTDIMNVRTSRTGRTKGKRLIPKAAQVPEDSPRAPTPVQCCRRMARAPSTLAQRGGTHVGKLKPCGDDDDHRNLWSWETGTDTGSRAVESARNCHGLRVHTSTPPGVLAHYGVHHLTKPAGPWMRRDTVDSPHAGVCSAPFAPRAI
ncbi:hypothetical protein VTO73DRAFT_1851 [Trametes versicolor]